MGVAPADVAGAVLGIGRAISLEPQRAVRQGAGADEEHALTFADHFLPDVGMSPRNESSGKVVEIGPERERTDRIVNEVSRAGDLVAGPEIKPHVAVL